MTEERVCIGLMLFLIGVVFVLFCSSCTISFQNISTHGTATDLVDETQTNRPDVKADLSVPAKLM